MPISRTRSKKSNIQTVYSEPLYIKSGTKVIESKAYTRNDGTVKESRRIVKKVYERNPDAKPIKQIKHVPLGY